MTATDKQTGISIRFIRAWKPESQSVITIHDRAFALAISSADFDDRPFLERLHDAYTFLKRQIH